MAQVRDEDRPEEGIVPSGATGVVVGIRDMGLRQEVLDHLERDPRITVEGSFAESSEVVTRLTAEAPGVAVLSVDMAAHVPFPSSRGPRRALLIVAQELTVPVLRTAIDAGAAAVFCWPQERRELLDAVAVASLAPASEPTTRGRVIAVFGARGGAGTTFVAAQLAASFADAGRSCVLVDLDRSFADLAVALSVEGERPPRTIADLLPVLAELAPAHVEDALFRHARGFAVLLAPADAAVEVPIGLYRACVAFLAGSFETVVLHLPRSFEDTARAGVAMADEVVLLVAPELFAVYSARRTVAAFGLGPSRPYRAVINPHLRGGLGPDVVAGVLGQAPAGRIRFDPAVRRAQERGQLLGIRNRRAARDVATLAHLVAPSPADGTSKRGPR